MKRLFLMLLILPMLAFMAGCTSAQAVVEYVNVYDNEDAGDPDVTVENEYLILQFNGKTTQFTLTEKSTGVTWYSNPADATSDPIAVKSAQESMQSQLLLNYGQINNSGTEINNFTLSLSNGTYTWEPVENGVKVMYTIGRVEKEFIVPHALSETRIMEYYALMEATDKRSIDNYYRILDINKLLATDNKDAMLEQYPDLENERIFILRDNLQKNILERLELAFENVGYTQEDFEQDKTATEKSEESSTPVFCVSMIYQLDGPDFVVTIPQEEIQYRSQYPILTLGVLPFFGAGSVEDEGYMLVPEASGAIINFNNGKNDQSRYINNLYGYDYGLKRTAIMNDSSASYPVFGINNNNSSFICVVEEGKEYATIEADVSGRLNSYNNVYSRYTVINSEDIDISKANVFAKVFDKKELNGLYKQRYIFVNTDNYVDLATRYRDYLMEHNPSLAKTEEDSVPVMLELVGAIDRLQNIMGMPVTVSTPLTTYLEAKEMTSALLDAGMDNMSVNLIGWFNGGVTHDAPGDVKLISELGGKKDFKELLSFMDEREVDLYLEANFSYIYNLSAFNGFSVNQDSAKRISREVAKMYPYSYVWFGQRTGTYGKRHSFYLAKPEYSMNTIDSFYADINKLGNANIAFSLIGRSLNSDFNTKNTVSRQTVMQLHQDKMAELRENGEKLMIRGGNDYAIPYVDFIIDMELDANSVNIIDEYIPFYQIVLHGLVPYAGGAVNLAQNYEYSVLKTVETGAGLYFTFMDASGQDLQETSYTRYYAADISRWGDQPVELYKRLNSELAHTVNQFITDYRKLASQVTLTEYEDGTQVIVNYTSESFIYEGHEVKGMDFVVIR